MTGIYEEARRSLLPKDGLVHVLMVNIGGACPKSFAYCDADYSAQMNELLFYMQRDGYEIIDIKFGTIKDPGLMGYTEGYRNLVLYR